jgi:hypothetical protein|tara:strand:- start:229 stop:423 length:195 start_codon:yes stop_codon:yes gene_type:complete
MKIDINEEEYNEIVGQIEHVLVLGRSARDQRTWGKSWTQEDKDEFAVRVVFLETLLDKLHEVQK